MAQSNRIACIVWPNPIPNTRRIPVISTDPSAAAAAAAPATAVSTATAITAVSPTSIFTSVAAILARCLRQQLPLSLRWGVRR
jgi:hypothetical protein